MLKSEKALYKKNIWPKKKKERKIEYPTRKKKLENISNMGATRKNQSDLFFTLLQ